VSSVIKIGMACHKLSVIPQNSLYVPIHVGAKNAIRRMDSGVYCYDDEGDNISDKNATYCELTAQYWLWKNVQADYYGLCHYRRFLCFNPNDAKRNLRGQIEAYAMDPFNIKKFGLEDEAQMREVIEGNDIVVGEEQKVCRLYTPRGNQSSAYKHWTAHDRDLIKTQDLEKMLLILREVAPEIGADAVEYLNGKEFLGFNCFVMRRKLFNEMCSIEFEVLHRLEQEVDLTDYNQQLTRIFGFMGEIIFSSYVYHIEKKGNYRIKRVPLVYFNYTDPLPEYIPLDVPDAIPVLFLNDFESDPEEFSTAVMWQSFLENMEEGLTYDVYFCVPDLTVAGKTEYREMAKSAKNLRITFIPYELYFSMMEDRTGEKFPVSPYLPWIFYNYERLMLFGEHLLFTDSIREMWETSKHTDRLVAAPYDILKLAEVCDIYEETAEKYLLRQVKRPLDWFNANTCVLNLQAMRTSLTPEEIFRKRLNDYNELRSPEELLNIICEGNVEILNQRWNTWYASDEYLKYALPRAPLTLYKQLLAAQRNPGIVSYLRYDALETESNELTYLYWKEARKTPFYEQIIAIMIEFRIARTRSSQKEVLNKLFPRGGRMRGMLSQLFPKGSRRNRFVKRVLGIFHLK